jgi:transposase
MVKYSLGIDVSKASFHVCLSTIDSVQRVKVQRSGTFSNNQSGFDRLTLWCMKERKDATLPFTVTMEATGVYYERLALHLHMAGYSVSVVLPNKAKKYIAALGIKTKNDKTDALALSKMGAEQSLPVWEPMDGFFYTLRSLTRQYQSIQELITATKSQLEAINAGMYQVTAVVESNLLITATLKQQLKAARKAISAHIASNKLVAQKVANLSSIAGVGELTVAVILAETGGFALFTNASQLVSYSGFDVVENQSGAHKGKTKISKKGNGRIRRALHMPSLCVVTKGVKVFKNLYERVYERSGFKMKGYVAVQKKLLTTMMALWRKNEAFDPDYQQQQTSLKTKEYNSQRLGGGVFLWGLDALGHTNKLALNEQG